MSTTYRKLIVIIPAFNEAANVARVIKGIEDVSAAISSFGWLVDVLVVNDGSVDGTAEAVKAAGARVITHPVNLGYGASLQTGFRYAKEKNYHAAITLDADGQHRPQDILRLVETFNGGKYDVILGSRFVVNTGYKTSLSRKIGISLFSLVFWLLSGKKIKDVLTGFQMVSRQVIHLFADEYPNDYPDTQVLLLLSRVGFKIKEVPVQVEQRLNGKSMHSSVKSLIYPVRNLLAISIVLLKIAQIRRQFTPARIDVE